MYRNIKKWSTNPSINPVRLTQAVNVSPRVDINQPNGLNARRVQKCKAEGALHFGVPTIIWHHQKWATEEEMGNRRRDGQQKKRWATEEEMGNRRRDGQQKKKWATEEEYKPQTVINPDRQRRFPHRWYRAPLLNKTSIEQDVIS
jgi:hypothetical protein